MTLVGGVFTLSDVMAFWAKLQTYREHEVWPAQSIGERYNDFLWCEVWPELTNAQKHEGNWRSVAETIVHKRAGWRFVAKAILQTSQNFNLPMQMRMLQNT